MLHYGSLLLAAAALIHQSDHVPCLLGPGRQVSLLVDSSLFHCRLAGRSTKGSYFRGLQNGCMVCFVCYLLLVSLFAVAPLYRFWSVGFSTCVFAVVFSLAFVCCLLRCGATSLFVWFVCCWFCCVVRWLSPAGCCLPPPSVVPCSVLVQFLCWSLPLGIWLLHATARLPCLNAWGVVVLCFLASFCFMAAKTFGPVWGLCYPSTHGAFVVVELCAPVLRYSSSDDPGPLGNR